MSVPTGFRTRNGGQGCADVGASGSLRHLHYHLPMLLAGLGVSCAHATLHLVEGDASRAERHLDARLSRVKHGSLFQEG